MRDKATAQNQASLHAVSGRIRGKFNRVDAVHRTLTPAHIRSSATVFVVDDDPMVRQSLCDALDAGGYQTIAFNNGLKFLEHFDPKVQGTVILDFEMPDLNGLQVLERLNARRATIPVIFFSGCSDVKVGVAAIQQGAFDFLTKPFGMGVLYGRADAAITRHLQQTANFNAFHDRLKSLTPREREVMQLVVDGASTKRIASRLGVTLQTAIKHRGRVLDKMQVENDVQLVNLVNSEISESLPSSPLR